MNWLVVVAALTVSALLTSGCQQPVVSEESAATPAEQDVVDEARAIPLVSSLNGEVLPGTVTLADTSEEVLNVLREGQQVRVFRNTREAGTRSPIHVHPFGGWTCVVSG